MPYQEVSRHGTMQGWGVRNSARSPAVKTPTDALIADPIKIKWTSATGWIASLVPKHPSKEQGTAQLRCVCSKLSCLVGRVPVKADPAGDERPPSGPDARRCPPNRGLLGHTIRGARVFGTDGRGPSGPNPEPQPLAAAGPRRRLAQAPRCRGSVGAMGRHDPVAVSAAAMGHLPGGPAVSAAVSPVGVPAAEAPAEDGPCRSRSAGGI
jgi:hypothetical protein